MKKNNDNLFIKNYKVLKYVFKFCPHLIIYACFYIISSVVKSIASVLLIGNAIDAVINNSGSSNINSLLSNILIYVFIILVCSIINTTYDNYIKPKYQMIFRKNIQHYIYSKVKDIDMESFDNPDFFDKFNRASDFATTRGFVVFNTIMNFLVNFTCMIALGTFIVIKDPILIVVIVLCSIMNIVILGFANKIWYKLFYKIQNSFRYKFYVSRTFYKKESAAELKVTNVNNLLIDKYDETCNNIEKNYKKAYKKVYGSMTLFYLFDTLIRNIGTYVVLIYRLLKGLISFSTFTETLHATTKFTANLGEVVGVLTTLKNNALYIDDFLWILNYKPSIEKEREEKDIKFNSLDIKNVSFRYNNTSINQINDLSIKINKGDKIAIVGENGGGKSTLMKLLLAFYNPTMGNILINDTNYLDISNKQIRNEYSIVFQDFKIYAATIIENVLMRKVKCKEDYDIALSALDKVGLKEKVLSLKMGLDTLVTREFDRDGVTFSGGEKQRLAIARVFASNKDIYILDEPTSSLDPLSEERINKLIINEDRSKTIIVIAHRLSTVVDCDKIYLIGNGSVIEEGTHTELMKLNKKYAKMFNTQKHMYEKNKEEDDV